MRSQNFSKCLQNIGFPALLALGCAVWGGIALADPKHGIAMYGEPALPTDFTHLPYANPDAPTGGRIVTGETGGFDSLNPHIRKGSVPWQLRFLAAESLMGRSYDEPFTLYGLLAESIETNEDRTWVEFTLREEAKFSDGSPVTVEDVMWSYETLGTEGHPRYAGFWKQVESMEQTGPRSVKFTFATDNRELALLAGMRPILKKAQWDGTEFDSSGLDVVPISSAPYVIDEVVPGKTVVLKRNPDYWGVDVPYMNGRANLDEIRMEFFGDATAQFEAFKAGVLTSARESNAEKWDREYDFPAIEDGRVVKSVIPHQRPSGITGLVMNTRKPQLADWRVREALILAFNFPYINDAMTGGKQTRITSYFSNSPLAMNEGPATGKVKELLDPFADSLLPGAMDGYALPEGAMNPRNRGDIRKALALLEDAGWTVQDGALKDAAGKPFEMEILLKQGSSENQSIVDIYEQALERLGIAPKITLIDSAQYKERTDSFDFDMTYYRRGLSLSPGNEQKLYWGCDMVETPGSRNWMGMCSEAADTMIDEILTSTSREDFLAATHALDRVLISGRYVVPFYQWNISRIAHAKELKFPETLPIYGDWIGWQPDVWWSEE